MANHQIPKRARRIMDAFGIDADGHTIRCRVYTHTRQGHQQPMFYVVQYRETAGKIDRDTRRTIQISGRNAQQRLDAEMAETLALFAATRALNPHAAAVQAAAANRNPVTRGAAS